MSDLTEGSTQSVLEEEESFVESLAEFALENEGQHGQSESQVDTLLSDGPEDDFVDAECFTSAEQSPIEEPEAVPAGQVAKQPNKASSEVGKTGETAIKKIKDEDEFLGYNRLTEGWSCCEVLLPAVQSSSCCAAEKKSQNWNIHDSKPQTAGNTTSWRNQVDRSRAAAGLRLPSAAIVNGMSDRPCKGDAREQSRVSRIPVRLNHNGTKITSSVPTGSSSNDNLVSHNRESASTADAEDVSLNLKKKNDKSAKNPSRPMSKVNDKSKKKIESRYQKNDLKRSLVDDDQKSNLNDNEGEKQRKYQQRSACLRNDMSRPQRDLYSGLTVLPQKPVIKCGSQIATLTFGNAELSEKCSNETPSNSQRGRLNTLSLRYKSRLKKYEDHIRDSKKLQICLQSNYEALLDLRGQLEGNFKEELSELPPMPSQNNVTATDTTSDVSSQEKKPPPSRQKPHTISSGVNTELEEENHKSLSQLQEENKKLSELIIQQTAQYRESVAYMEQNKKELPELNEMYEDLRNILVTSEEKQKLVEQKLSDLERPMQDLKDENKTVSELKMRLKQRDNIISSLRKQQADTETGVGKEIEDHQKKLQHEMVKREKLNTQLIVAKADNENISSRIAEVEKLYKESVDRENEHKQKMSTMNEQIIADKECLKKLEKKLQEKCDLIAGLQEKAKEGETQSASVVGLSEQLIAKDSIISQLEGQRDEVQQQNTDMCQLLSEIFTQGLGKALTVEEIESSLSSGRIYEIQEELIKLIADFTEAAVEEVVQEYMKKNKSLEDQINKLKTELTTAQKLPQLSNGTTQTETIKKFPEPRRHEWGPPKCNIIENIRTDSNGAVLTKSTSVVDQHNEASITTTLGSERSCDLFIDSLVMESNGDIKKKRKCDLKDLVPQNEGLPRTNFEDLFVLLEGKRQALLRMERKVQDLEVIHSQCAQRRTRNEARIAQLELMLAVAKYKQIRGTVKEKSQE